RHETHGADSPLVTSGRHRAHSRVTRRRGQKAPAGRPRGGGKRGRPRLSPMPGKILVDITPLRESRDFRLLFTGQLISMLGTQLTVVAIPYQVYGLTHSSLQVGAISLAQLFPFIAGALVAGPLGDSLDRRRIMLWTAGALGLTSVALALNA